MNSNDDCAVARAEPRRTPDIELADRLVRDQFPQWAHLPLRSVQTQGCDNRTFRLGSDLSVRLPSAPAYDAQVEKEHRWLPVLAAALPLPIPRPVAKGRPTTYFPASWSVYGWHAGRALVDVDVNEVDLTVLATDLGAFLAALREVPAQDGPPPGAHNFLRGAAFDHYAEEAERALARLAPELRQVGRRCVGRATASSWSGPPTWVHGDIAPGNLLLVNGQLSAVIDFGCSAVGDPACDLVAAWTVFDRTSRALFRRTTGLDPDTWDRAGGWAVWKAAITLTSPSNTPAELALARRTFAALAEEDLPEP